MSYQGGSSGVLERMTPPTLRAVYLFWLMQITQGEVDPSFINDLIFAGGGILQRATLNALELETLLSVHVAVGRVRKIIGGHRLHPVHGAVLRSLDHAERLLVRRSTNVAVPHRRERSGGIALLSAKVTGSKSTQRFY